jgi:cytochrome c2
MSSHKKIALIFSALVILVFLVAEAAAGGWAVVTLDALPGKVVAERPFTIGFVVRQHGQTLTGGLIPTVTAVNVKSGDRVEFTAEEQGTAGHYTTIITLPQPGPWEWTINAFGFDQPMPEIAVEAVPAAQPVPSGDFGGLGSLLHIITVVSMTFFVLLLYVWWRTRQRRVMALLLGTAVLLGAGQVIQQSNPAETVAAQPSLVEAASPGDLGQALFVAKGCIMCHKFDRVMSLASPQIGPNLTHYAGSPDYLRSWLSNPQASKPESRMPNLQLNAEEIEALIGLLTVSKGKP